MSDRRAVTAGRLAAPSVAGEMWRVAVGGNRVENMTVEEIAHAYHSGHLTVRTPLWPPGTSGWQALGNFEQFQYAPSAHDAAAAPYQANGYQQLSQFQEGDDDPTRMWTGAADLEIDIPAPMPVAPVPSAPPPARPSARTGPRQVPSRAPQPVSAAPVARAQRVVSSAPTASPSAPPFRGRRSSGWLLVAGLVGLVGLGSAVLAARGNWSSAAMDKTAAAAAPEAAAEPTAAPAAEAAPAAAAAPSAAGEAAPSTVNGVAKYDESGASAFVAGAEPAKAAAGAEGEAAAETKPAESEAKSDDASEAEEAVASAPAKGRRSRTAKEKARSAPKRSLSAKASSTQNAKRATASVSSKSKSEASESDEPAPAPSSSSPASSSVNEAAAAALANSAKLASSCRPRGGPSGAGKARIIYSQDGEVQSVEILTAKFRDTLTGSCVRMVFRRAKIPPFKGEPPTFIKSFTIPEE